VWLQYEVSLGCGPDKIKGFPDGFELFIEGVEKRFGVGRLRKPGLELCEGRQRIRVEYDTRDGARAMNGFKRFRELRLFISTPLLSALRLLRNAINRFRIVQGGGFDAREKWTTYARL